MIRHFIKHVSLIKPVISGYLSFFLAIYILNIFDNNSLIILYIKCLKKLYNLQIILL